ncbi:hypothetical protein ACNR9Q_05330 [Maribacter sp. X9]|uniref:hypothetical protein n=1 Tax=Maribacter sp. X9 TaxID=3402159 RepID=UPI003AF3D580
MISDPSFHIGYVPRPVRITDRMGNTFYGHKKDTKTVAPRAPLYVGARYDVPVSPNPGFQGTQVEITILGLKASFPMVAITTTANTKERGWCILTPYLKKPIPKLA